MVIKTIIFNPFALSQINNKGLSLILNKQVFYLRKKSGIKKTIQVLSLVLKKTSNFNPFALSQIKNMGLSLVLKKSSIFNPFASRQITV